MINKNGLTSDEVIKNRKKYGNNSLTKKNNDIVNCFGNKNNIFN